MRVKLVCLKVECGLGGENTHGDVVWQAAIVIGRARGDGEIFVVLGVRVVEDGSNDPEK